MSRRTSQIESTLKRAISQVLQRQIADPRIEGLVSITQVTVSPDLHEAYVYVSVLPQSCEKKTLNGLRHAVKHIHAATSKLVALRTVPRFDFRLDESLKRQAEVHAAIRKGLDRSGEPVEDNHSPQGPSPREDTEEPMS